MTTCSFDRDSEPVGLQARFGRSQLPAILAAAREEGEDMPEIENEFEEGAMESDDD